MGIRHEWSRIVDLVSLAVHPPVGGAMAGRTGRSYGRAELADSEYLAPDDDRVIHAFPVPSLLPIILRAPTEADLPGALEALLCDRVCAFDWRVERAITGPLRKYGMLHTSIDAPIDEKSGERMSL